VVGLAITLITSSLALAQDAPAARSGGRIVVDATGLRSDRGRLRCFLLDQADAYPTHPERAVATTRAAIRGSGARCTFEGVAAGTYAIALHHDEDDDDRVDTGIFGIPTEGTGASRDARGSMGPPSFRDAQFVHDGGETSMTIRMAYVF
jgi:uncharacterized protein (DUF2141 family)